jgi:hypothetical protein
MMLKGVGFLRAVRWIVIVGVVVAVSVVLIGYSVQEGSSPQPDAIVRPSERSGVIANSMVGNAERAGYPKAWRAESLADATERATFDVIVPQYGPATDATLMEAFVLPTGAVAFDYIPPVKEPDQYVRQEYIEVFQAPWTDGEAPELVYERDLQTSPDSATSLTSIDGGVVALTVEAHSEQDLELANPAFVRFVVDGIEVQISGGEDLSLLLAIAESMVVDASTRQR